MFLAFSVERCICCCGVRRVSWGLCVGVLGSFLWVGVLVGLCLWFRYPVSGVGVDCADAEAMNKCML